MFLFLYVMYLSVVLSRLVLHVVPEDPKFEHDKRRKYANNVHAVTTGYAGPKLIVSTLQKSCYALQNEKGYVELRE